MLRGQLNRIQHTQNFVEVPAGAHRIAEHQFDLPIRTDNENSTHCRVECRSAALGSIPGIGRQHVIELRDLQFGIADQRVIHLVALCLFDVCRPFAVTADGVHAQPEDLAVSFGEFGLQSGHISEFRRADRSEIFWM